MIINENVQMLTVIVYRSIIDNLFIKSTVASDPIPPKIPNFFFSICLWFPFLMLMVPFLYKGNIFLQNVS